MSSFYGDQIMSTVPSEPPPVLATVGSRDLSEVWKKDQLGVSVENVGPALVHHARGKTLCALVLEAYLQRSRTAPDVSDEMETPWRITGFDREKGTITLKLA